jgi:hypothetical protein
MGERSATHQRQGERKQFFFEKKNQKTFVYLVPRFIGEHSA